MPTLADRWRLWRMQVLLGMLLPNGYLGIRGGYLGDRMGPLMCSYQLQEIVILILYVPMGISTATFLYDLSKYAPQVFPLVWKLDSDEVRHKIFPMPASVVRLFAIGVVVALALEIASILVCQLS